LKPLSTHGTINHPVVTAQGDMHNGGLLKLTRFAKDNLRRQEMQVLRQSMLFLINL
jgi:hypothetical protein